MDGILTSLFRRPEWFSVIGLAIDVIAVIAIVWDIVIRSNQPAPRRATPSKGSWLSLLRRAVCPNRAHGVKDAERWFRFMSVCADAGRGGEPRYFDYWSKAARKYHREYHKQPSGRAS